MTRAPSMAMACRLYFLIFVFNVNNYTEQTKDNMCTANPIISSRNDGSWTTLKQMWSAQSEGKPLK